MRRRQIFAQRFQNRQSVTDPSVAAGSGPAVDAPPVSREQEEKSALIWTVMHGEYSPTAIDLTPATDPTANAPKKRGWPKGKKRKP